MARRRKTLTIDELSETLENVNPKALLVVKKSINETFREMMSFVSLCQSPIEEILAAELCCWCAWRYQPFNTKDKPIKNHTYIHPQHNVKIGDKTYRADFFIERGEYKLVIECDGHDFHERTKEQAAHDKQRDRELMTAGYDVLHFTGSEIYADSVKCVNEILDYLNSKKQKG